ncbi:hypothetical protein PR202_gb12231 [Eleusine coracana subsp. coracana]|uniref:Helicase C-terminal domain-containing protein n=1 Tax=Eleusine coracana subsp. coracana TaxID=191504 RepID=A0AAV5EQ21_ELECO|nr:hypothetical protein PR202_gb12231 [Eleusine coracana subsp. coracana]
MISLLRRALAPPSSSPAATSHKILLAALLSRSPAPTLPLPCSAPALPVQPAPEPPRRAFHGSASPLGFRATPGLWAAPGPEAGVPAGEEGLEIARLGISPLIVERLAARGITKLFPIQRAVLEPAMQGKDMIGRARTGTGKTLAFGRVIDLLRRGVLNLSEIQFVVLDESDQMLAVGFDEDVEVIMENLPQNRQKEHISLTFLECSLSLTFIILPQVGDSDQKLPEGISLYSIASDNYGKPSILGPLIKEHANGGKCIVFTQTKREADRLAYVMGRSYPCQALHGDISQNQRERTLSGFRDGRFNILVATDVAARGLDIPNVDLVVHYEIPNTSELFVHRSGRTARAGKKGSAILIYTYEQTRAVRVIEQDIGCRFTEVK